MTHRVDVTSVANMVGKSSITGDKIGMRVDWMHQGFPSPRFVRDGNFAALGRSSCRVARVEEAPCGPMFRYGFYGGHSLVCTPDTMVVTLLGTARVKQCLDGGMSVITKGADGADVLSMVTSEFPVLPPLVGYEIFLVPSAVLPEAEDIELSRVTRARVPCISVNHVLLAAAVAP
jgi:hypothetical protein